MLEYTGKAANNEPSRLPQANLGLAQGQCLVAGILGGLGPLPHIHFERLLLEKMRDRGISQEQGYPVWVVLNAAPMPDRTACLLKGNEECLPGLVAAGRMLANAGAHFIVTICNTAHAFRERTMEKLSIPWVDMLQIVAHRLLQEPKGIASVGLLATDGTVQTGIYPQALKARGLHDTEVLYPSTEGQKAVMEAIYDKDFGVKSAARLSVSEEALKRFEIAARELMQRGASVIISGCTEISLCSAELRQRGIPILDPLDALADTVIALSYGELNVASFS